MKVVNIANAMIKLQFKVYIRKWLKIYHSTTNICLYSSTYPCPLPIKSLTSILKAAKVSGHLLLTDSLDPIVNTSVPNLKVGEWKVEDVVKQGEDKIEFEKVLGYKSCPMNKYFAVIFNFLQASHLIHFPASNMEIYYGIMKNHTLSCYF